MSLSKLFRITNLLPPGELIPEQWPYSSGTYCPDKTFDTPRYRISPDLQVELLSRFCEGDFINEGSSQLEPDGVLTYKFNQTYVCQLFRHPWDPYVTLAVESLYSFTVDFERRHAKLPSDCQVCYLILI